MSATEVVVVRTGAANLASVAAALERLGRRPQITDDPNVVASAAHVVLPGVGAFGPAMAHLRERGLDEAVVNRVRDNKPLLAICLGMQLLCESSEENPGVRGLGIVPAHITRFGPSARVPQLGWNIAGPLVPLVRSASYYMYFANSYCLRKMPEGWRSWISDYDGMFVSALERGRLLACQFHPELSGRAGSQLIADWLEPLEC